MPHLRKEIYLMDFDNIELNAPQEEQPKPKKRIGLILGIVAVVAAIALVLVLFLGQRAKKGEDEPVKVLDPHSAMLAAQQDALYSLIDAFTPGMDNLDSVYGETGTCSTIDLHVLLSESILDRLELIVSSYGMDLDLSFLQDIAISIDTNSQDLLTQYLVGLGLGDKEITYLDYIMDLDKGALYMGLPELSSNYVATEFLSASDLTTALQPNLQSALEKLAEGMPNRDALQSSLHSYVDLLLEQLKEPTIAEEEVTIDGVTQTLTTVTYRLTEAQLAEFCKAALEKLQEDEAIMQFIEAYIDYLATIMESTGEPMTEDLDDYKEALQEAIAKLDTTIAEAMEGNYLDLTGYLDQKQNLRGYKLAINYEGEDAPQTLHWISLVDGDKELVEIVLNAEAEQQLLTVTGKQTKKDGLYNGTFKLSFPDKKALTVELMDMTMDPFLKGSIQLTPNTNLLKEILGDSYTTMRVLGSNLGLRFNVEGGNTSGSFGIHLTADGSSLVGIDMDVALKNSDPITLPEESQLLTGSYAMDELLASLDLTKLPKKLEDAGVPSDLVDLLELFVVMPEDAA